MGVYTSPAIIMRIRDFGESDLLVSFFTPDRGRLKGIARGARKSRRRFSNCLDLFCLSNIEYEIKRKSDLYFLHSCKLVHAFPGLRSDFGTLSLASYMVELTEILFPLSVVDRDMFELLKSSFFALDGGEMIDRLRILFETKAMCLGGYKINFETCCNCGRTYKGEGRAVFAKSKGGIACLKCGKESNLAPGLGPDAVKTLQLMQSEPLNKIETSALSDEIICEIKPVLKFHMEYRIGKRLKSAEYL